MFFSGKGRAIGFQIEISARSVGFCVVPWSVSASQEICRGKKKLLWVDSKSLTLLITFEHYGKKTAMIFSVINKFSCYTQRLLLKLRVLYHSKWLPHSDPIRKRECDWKQCLPTYSGCLVLDRRRCRSPLTAYLCEKNYPLEQNLVIGSPYSFH